MSEYWDTELILLTKEEMRLLPTWTKVISISGTESTIMKLDIEDLDTRFGQTNWGVYPWDYERVGEIVMRRNWMLPKVV